MNNEDDENKSTPWSFETPIEPHTMRWVLAGVTLLGTWVLAVLSHKRRDLMRVHNFSLNLITPSADPHRLFRMAHRTLFECPLDDAVDNKWAAWRVARAGRKLSRAPFWKKPLLRSPLRRGAVYSPPPPIAPTTAAATNIIRLSNPTEHRSVMTSLLNRVSAAMALPYLHQAMGAPTHTEPFVMFLTCEHERVWFLKTRTILTSEAALQQVAALLKQGIPITPDQVELETNSTSVRLQLLKEMALVYDHNPQDVFKVQLTIPLYPGQPSPRLIFEEKNV